MSGIFSKVVVALKRLYYTLYYSYSGFVSYGNFFYFLCFSLRTIFHLISDYFTWNIETVHVKVEEGELRGKKVESVLGKTFYSFRGIPYAKPPVGPLRFKDPEPPEKWTGVRDAFRHGDMCAQWDWITGLFIGKEDSLFLNVYTPQIPKSDGTPLMKRAVLFWIHGGAFFFGFSNDILFGPDLFMSEDVVLVTINYRLGPLGFLTTGTKDAPGNAGFKDTIQALKWVNRNIASFGGDPENVTVFGESSGATMAETLMLSPLAKGLFHKVIAESGTSSSWWNFSENLIDCSFSLGKILGVHTNNPKFLIESLQKLPPRRIILKQKNVLSEKRKRHSVPFEFSLCAESEDDPKAALTGNPRELIRQGKFISDVPFMTGINEKEGMSFLHATLLDYPKIKELEKDFENLVPEPWNLKPGSVISKKVAAEMRKYYLQGKPLNESTYDELVDLATDQYFLEPFLASTRSHLKHLKSPVYNYKFNVVGNRNIYKKMLNFQKIKGSSHSDEVFYLFQVPGLGKNLDANCTEVKTAKRMVRLWSNFAKYGDPTPDPNDDLLQRKVWPRAVKEGNPHLVICDNLSVSHDGVFEERAKFWDDLKAEYAPNV